MLCKSACMTSSFHRLPEGRCVVCNDCSDYVNGVRMDVIRQAAPLAWRVAMAPHCMTSSQRSQPGELGDLGVALGLSSKALSCICYMAFFVPAFHIAFQVVYSICIR